MIYSKTIGNILSKACKKFFRSRIDIIGGEKYTYSLIKRVRLGLILWRGSSVGRARD